VTRPNLFPPYGIFIKERETAVFNYWNHSFSIEYVSANPQRVVVLMDNEIIKEIVKDVNDSPRGVYWSYDGFNFELKPVVRKVNEEGRAIPYYEETWNTTELYFEVRASGHKS